MRRIGIGRTSGGLASFRHVTDAKITMVEKEVLAFLLGSGAPLTLVELEREMGGDLLDLSNALQNLAVAKLIDLSEVLVALADRPREGADARHPETERPRTQNGCGTRTRSLRTRRPWTVQELVLEVGRDRLDTIDAIVSLESAGLVHRIGEEFVFPTRAARRTDEINLSS